MTFDRVQESNSCLLLFYYTKKAIIIEQDMYEGK